MRRIILCKSPVLFTPPVELWKTIVEKSVENVENCEFSTVILPQSDPPESCGKPLQPGLHNTLSGCADTVLRHHPYTVSSCQK